MVILAHPSRVYHQEHCGYSQQKVNLVLLQPYYMDMKNRCQSCRSNCIIQLGKCYCCNDDNEDANSMSLSAIGSSKLRWKVLWMKLKKEKKKLFESASSPPLHQAPYDPYTYSQNFDQGTAKDEPENLSRSFSARFADPSRAVIVKKRVL